MLKLSLIYENIDSKKPVSKLEKRIISNIKTSYPQYFRSTYLTGLDLVEIFKILLDKFALPYEIASEIYFLLINNFDQIKKDTEGWENNPSRESSEVIEIQQKILGKYLNLPPDLIVDNNAWLGEVHEFCNSTEGECYFIGTLEEAEKSIDEHIENLFLNISNDKDIMVQAIFDTEYAYQYDVSRTIPKYIYIEDFMIEDIAERYAGQELRADYGDDANHILYYAAIKRPDIDRHWEELQGSIDNITEMIENTQDQNQKEYLQEKLDEKNDDLRDLISIATEFIKEKYFNEKVEELINNPLEWLVQEGYVKNINGDYIISKYHSSTGGLPIQKNFPAWLRVDLNRVRKDLYEMFNEDRGRALAYYDQRERTVVYDDTTYYIYRTQ